MFETLPCRRFCPRKTNKVNDELTGSPLDHSQVIEGMKAEGKQPEHLKVGRNMAESSAKKLAKEKGHPENPDACTM